MRGSSTLSQIKNPLFKKLIVQTYAAKIRASGFLFVRVILLDVTSSIGGMFYSSFLGRILIKVGRNTLTPMTSWAIVLIS